MRIIKEGNIIKKELQIQCKQCGCEFAFEQEDIKIDNRDGNYVVCPYCGKFINTDKFNLNNEYKD